MIPHQVTPHHEQTSQSPEKSILVNKQRKENYDRECWNLNQISDTIFKCVFKSEIQGWKKIKTTKNGRK